MPSLFNQVKNIMSTINGGQGKDLVGDSNLDDRIDSLSSISTVDPNKRNSYFELFRDSLYANRKMTNNDIVDQLSKDLVGTFASQKRIDMYDDIQSVIRKLPILTRAVRIFVDNILSPDDITKISIQVVAKVDSEKEDTDKFNPLIDEFENIVKAIRLDEIIRKLITNVLIEGDRFYEITTVKSDFVHTAKLNNIILKEEKYKVKDERDSSIKEMSVFYEETPALDFSFLNYTNPSFIREDYYDEDFNDGINNIMEANYKLVDPDNPDNTYNGPTKTVTFVPADSEKDSSKITDFINTISSNNDGTKTIEFKPEQNSSASGNKQTIIPVNKIRLIDHNPRNIVIIRKRNWIMGYLYVDVLNSKNGVSSENKNKPFDDELNSSNELIDKLYKSVLVYLKDKAVDEIPDDLKDTITNILKNNIKGDVVVRFIPIENIQHFKNDSEEFDPYGESYFYNLLPMIKMYLSRLVSSTIYALARAGRHLLVEVDCTNDHDARNRIEAVRRALKKREITGDDINSLDTVFKYLTTFDDVYIPSKDGKRMVNIETLDLGSASDRDAEDDKLLKNILTGIEIPPSLLGIEEFTNSRNTLSQESILFARSIIRLQMMFTDQITSLIQKIYVLMHKKSKSIDSNYEMIRVTFPAPQGLMSGNRTEILSNRQNEINIWTQLGYAPKDAKAKVIPEVDWNKVEAKAFAQPQDQNQMGGDMGMMGGMGGDMGMMGGDMGGFDMGGVDSGMSGDFDNLGGDMGMSSMGGTSTGMSTSQALSGGSLGGDLSSMGIQ